MSNDIVIGTTSIPYINNVKSKPAYLIVISEPYGKTKIIKKFITLDKPEFLNGFVQAKGVFSELEDDEIFNNYSSLLTNAPKDLILEMMIPWHKIDFIRSLVFKAK